MQLPKTTVYGQSAVRTSVTVAKLAGISLAALVLANCAKQPSGGSSAHKSREIGAFSDPKYGKASPRVVGMDEDAPKGGGRYHIGNPYVVAGRRYVPRERPVGYTVTGHASWYGIAFHGRKTANGEIYDRNSVSAAHPTMPIPSYARVTNLANNHSIIVRVNDRGPYHSNRVMDVSERTAKLLDFRHVGTARVKIDYLGPASLAGSDDARLVASLNTSGPARSPGNTAPTMVASVAPIATAVPASPPAPTGQPLAFTANSAGLPVSRPAPQSSGVITETRFTPVVNAPVPPARPFDLETIGGAARPVAPGSLPSTASGQRLSSADFGRELRPTDLAFVEMGGDYSRFRQDMGLAKLGIFEGLQPGPGDHR